MHGRRVIGSAEVPQIIVYHPLSPFPLKQLGLIVKCILVLSLMEQCGRIPCQSINS